MKRLNQSGSHVIAIAIGLLVLGVVAFAGYTVMQHNDTTKASTTPSTVKVTTPATIKTSADLTAAATQLDTSSAQVDSSLNDTALDSDLNDLL